MTPAGVLLLINLGVLVLTACKRTARALARAVLPSEYNGSLVTSINCVLELVALLRFTG
jgi:hypothetical protein